ncbi:MAG: TolC family protein [Vicingaceae bacterium]
MYRNQLKRAFLFVFVFSGLVAFSQEKTLRFSLVEAQQFAIENSYQSQVAEKEVLKSKRKVKETISTGLPQVNASGNYQQYLEVPVQLVPAPIFGGPEGEFEEVFFGTEQQMGVDVRATQLLFDGTYFVGLQASKVYLELSKNDRMKTETEVRKMVTQAYGNVLVTEKNVEILKQNRDNLAENLKETKALYENGFVEEQDKDQLELLLANAKNAYEQAVRQIEISKNQLKFAMGIDVSEEVELSQSLKEITTENQSETYLSEEFNVQSHIDYKVINTQEKATELLWKQQKSTYLPNLSGFYSYQQNSFSNEFNFFSDSRWFPTQVIGLNVSVPIFSSLGRNQRVQQAKLDYQMTNIAKKQVEQQLLIQAENAKSEYTFALNQYQTRKDNLELAERIYQKTKTKYDEGVSSSLELTQANNQLLETQGNFINAALQLINAKANLDQALNTY